MFRIAKSRGWPPDVDLTTVRETIAYIEGDMRRVPGFERIADALSSALTEIETVERRAPRAFSYSAVTARFLPRR